MSLWLILPALLVIFIIYMIYGIIALRYKYRASLKKALGSGYSKEKVFVQAAAGGVAIDYGNKVFAVVRGSHVAVLTGGDIIAVSLAAAPNAALGGQKLLLELRSQDVPTVEFQTVVNRLGMSDIAAGLKFLQMLEEDAKEKSGMEKAEKPDEGSDLATSIARLASAVSALSEEVRLVRASCQFSVVGRLPAPGSASTKSVSGGSIQEGLQAEEFTLPAEVDVHYNNP